MYPRLICIDRDCETDALRGQNDRGIYTDDLSPRRDQRPAGITGIKRSVGLNHVIDQAAGLRSKRPAKSANHSRRHRCLETVGISDRDHELTDSNRLGIAQRDRNEIRRCDSHYGQIGIRIIPNLVRQIPLPIRQSDCNLAGAMNYVAVGQNESVRRKYKSRTGSSQPPLLADINFDHRRTHTLRRSDDDFGIGIK